MFRWVDVWDIFEKLSPEQKEALFNICWRIEEYLGVNNEKDLRRILNSLGNIIVEVLSVGPDLFNFKEAEIMAKKRWLKIPMLEELLIIFLVKELLRLAYPDEKWVPKALKDIWELPDNEKFRCINNNDNNKTWVMHMRTGFFSECNIRYNSWVLGIKDVVHKE
jgi:hypothetical protein